MGHVNAGRVAPFGDDIAEMDDEPGRIAALFERADRVTERLAAEGLVVVEVVEHEIARIAYFAGNGEIRRLLKPRRNPFVQKCTCPIPPGVRS